MKHFLFRYWWIIFIIALTYLTIQPVFIPGFFPMHDDTQPARVFEMKKALQDGMFPVRWSHNLGYGYGYPIFNFYAPLAYYIGSFFMFLGIDALIATKLMIVTGFVISGFSMYLLAREFWGDSGAILSSLLYLYAPYHALDLYVRGDVAEIWAYAFVPLVFLSLYKVRDFGIENSKLTPSAGSGQVPSSSARTGIQSAKSQLIDKKTWLWMSIGSLSYAAIITSHNLTAMMVTPFIFVVVLIYSWFLYKNKKLYGIRHMVYVITVGILLSAFYWLPALGEMHYTNVLSQVGGKADHHLHFVCPYQLWDSPWGFGGSAPGCIDGMSFRIGKLHLIFAAFSLAGFLYFRERDKKRSIVALVGILLLAVAVWLTTEYSKIFWDSIPLMKFFQYPWRFLLVISFLTSLLGGSVVWLKDVVTKSRGYMSTVFFIFLCISVVFFYGKLFHPQTVHPKTPEDYVSESALRWNISKISDEYLPKGFHKPESQDGAVNNKLLITGGNGVITLSENKTQVLRADIESDRSPAEIFIKTAYFPAWKVVVNNKNYSYDVRNSGLSLTVPEGKSTLSLEFRQTGIEKVANMISLAGIAVLLLGIMRALNLQQFIPTFHRRRER